MTLPIHLSCLTRPRIGASSIHAAHGSRNYFRLLEADRDLRARATGAPRSMGIDPGGFHGSRTPRLGRELHSGVGQSLAGIHVHASMMEAALPDPPEAVRKSLDRIHRWRVPLWNRSEASRGGMYVPAWQAQSLVDALRDLWEASGISEKFAGTLDLQRTCGGAAAGGAPRLYLVAQEGISNAIQHADARRVRMSLREEGGRIALEVADDGSGFRTPGTPHNRRRRGHRAAVHARSGARVGRRTRRRRASPEGATLTISFPVIP